MNSCTHNLFNPFKPIQDTPWPAMTQAQNDRPAFQFTGCRSAATRPWAAVAAQPSSRPTSRGSALLSAATRPAWASYSRAVSTLRLGGAIDANDAMRAAGQGPVLQRARDGGQGGFRGLGRGNGLRGSRGISDGKVRAVGGVPAPCGACLGSNANFPSCKNAALVDVV